VIVKPAIGGKFIDDGMWDDKCNLTLSDEFFERCKHRLLLVILGNVEPHTCVYQKVEWPLFSA